MLMHRQRGASLLEGLIGLLILSFGVLGLIRFQAGMLMDATDAQRRLVANELAEELLARVRVDTLNVNCYTVPQVGACTSAIAKEQAASWAAAATAQGFLGAGSALSTPTQFSVTLNWTSKNGSELRTLRVSTDARN